MPDRVPPLSALLPDDWGAQFLSLMPEGEVWPRDPDAILPQAIAALVGGVYQRLAVRDGNLLVDSFPTTTLELLPEWEATLGLPDACSPANPTVGQRIAAVRAKIVATGGQSIPYFIAVAAALGFTITVDEFSAFRVGTNRVGDHLYGTNWAFAWRVNAATATVQYFRVGQSAVGDPLASSNNNPELQCRLSAIAPARTTLFFAYS